MLKCPKYALRPAANCANRNLWMCCCEATPPLIMSNVSDGIGATEPVSLPPELRHDGASIDLSRLTSRQRQVLTWIAQGKTDWEIGRILSISAKTVNFHAEAAKRRLRAATRGQAVAMLNVVMPQDASEPTVL